jgi:thioredoxin 1
MKHLKKVLLLAAITTLNISAIGTSREEWHEEGVTEITNLAELNDFLKTHKLAVVEFYNRTCPVCQHFKQARIYPTLAGNMPSIGFAKVSKQEANNLHTLYSISSFPTFIFFKDGRAIEEYSGFTSLAPFEKKINAIFSR